MPDGEVKTDEPSYWTPASRMRSSQGKAGLVDALRVAFGIRSRRTTITWKKSTGSLPGLSLRG